MPAILVVDDEPAILEAVGELLRDGGYAVDTTPNGAAALGHLDRADPELILSDVMMPGVDGYALVQRLRDRGDHTPVILMSAGPNPACALPGVRCLRKPFDVDDLPGEVEAILPPGGT